VLTKATVVLGVTFLVNTTLLAWLGARPGTESVVDRNPVEAAPLPPGGGPGTDGSGGMPPPGSLTTDGAGEMGTVAPGSDAALPVDLDLPSGESTAVVEIPAVTDDVPAPGGADAPPAAGDGVAPAGAAADTDAPPSAQ
jgi:hypothetical protein